MLAKIQKTWIIGAKKNSKGHEIYWRGDKLHLDVADGQIPITAVLTGASAQDTQVAIPLVTLASERTTCRYDLMESAYAAAPIRTMSSRLPHVPMIDRKIPPKPRTQLPYRVIPILVLDPPEAMRFWDRIMIERVNVRLKGEFGVRFVRVRGAAIVRFSRTPVPMRADQGYGSTLGLRPHEPAAFQFLQD